METLSEIIDAVKLDNMEFTKMGWEPILQVSMNARILIIGQAPGIRTQLEGDVFRDLSGDRLRDWMGIDESTFYDSGLISILPMDFYFPGKGKTGDLPPRKDFASKWHPLLLECMSDVVLIILIGTYAQNYYLKDVKKRNLTETVRSYRAYLPDYFPLVHPSPLNRRWEAKNPWFVEDVLPEFKKVVWDVLNR